ncbi:MAG: hypothetical protein EPO26_13500 [Chloroflexota bacterium]|nr:MAG: hypothetical protein EPO26_13500 [Chloroflexota bacterium]
MARSDIEQRRASAWAGLVSEVARPELTVAEVAKVLRESPGLMRTFISTGNSVKLARASLASTRAALDGRPGDGGTARAWADCLEEILSLTERLCQRVGATG